MRWKSHVRFGGRAGETDLLRDRHRAPARSHLANTKLDECRRRVQNETMGHRGHRWKAKEAVRELYAHRDPDLALQWVTELSRDL
jgi:hypothetical protein